MRIREDWKLPLQVLGGVIAGLMLLAFGRAAFADTIPTKTPTRAQAAVAAPENLWTGCALGAYGGLLQGALDFGAPVALSTEGATFGAVASCDWQSGRGVFGGFVNYGWAFGDPKTVGINTDLALGGRAGYLVYPSVLPYLLVAWSRVDTDFGNVDGYKVGGGVEIKLPDSPVFLDFRVDRGFYSNVLSSGLDAESTTMRAGMSWKFNFLR